MTTQSKTHIHGMDTLVKKLVPVNVLYGMPSRLHVIICMHCQADPPDDKRRVQRAEVLVHTWKPEPVPGVRYDMILQECDEVKPESNIVDRQVFVVSPSKVSPCEKHDQAK